MESFDAPASPRTPKILFPEIEEMITVDQKDIIRREYFLNRKSMQKIAKELHHSCTTIRKANYDPGIPTDAERPRSQENHSRRPASPPLSNPLASYPVAAQSLPSVRTRWGSGV